MSDDVITNFLQSQPAANSSVQVEGTEGKGSQNTDFKQIFSHEEKKLFNDSKEVSAEGPQKKQGPVAVEELAKKEAEAIPSQNKDRAADEAGIQLPSLSIHNGALAVGRIIYTSKDVAVTNASLSKFMARQGLVNNSLKGAGVGSAELSAEKIAIEKASAPIKIGQGLSLVGTEDTHSVKRGVNNESLERNLQRQASKEHLHLGIDATTPNKSETVREVGAPNLKQSASLVGQFGRTSGDLIESSKPVLKVNNSPDTQHVVNKVENEPSANQLAKQSDVSSLASPELKNLAKSGSESETSYEALKSVIESKAPAEALSKNLERQLQHAERDQGAKLAEAKAEPPREGLKSEVLFKNKEYAQESLTKNQNANGSGEDASGKKKEPVHGQLHL